MDETGRGREESFRLVADTSPVLVWMSDADTRCTGYIGSCVDITSLRNAQTELVYSTERLHLALESGKSLARDWDLKAGRDTCFGDLRAA